MYPTMTFREYIRRHASKTRDGKFYCDICKDWINKQRWIHFKLFHRFKKPDTAQQKLVQ